MDELKKTILAVKFKKLGPFAFSIVLLGDLKSSHQSEILHSLIFCAIDPSYNIFTARKQSLRRLCFYACLSFCSGGGLLHFMLGCTPLDQRQASPPGADTPSPSAVHAGKYGQQTGGTHPTGKQSCQYLHSVSMFALQVRVKHW